MKAKTNGKKNTKNRLSYVVTHDPTSAKAWIGGRFSTLDVDLGVEKGHWPEGIRLTRNGVEYEIIGPELKRQKIVRAKGSPRSRIVPMHQRTHHVYR